MMLQCEHKVMQNNKIWNICANTKSTGFKFCRVYVLQELHILIVVMMSAKQHTHYQGPVVQSPIKLILG